MNANVSGAGVVNYSATGWAILEYNITGDKYYLFTAENFPTLDTSRASMHICFYNSAGTLIQRITIYNTYTLPFGFQFPVGTVRVVQNVKTPDDALPTDFSLTSTDKESAPVTYKINGNPVSAGFIEENEDTKDQVSNLAVKGMTLQFNELQSLIASSSLQTNRPYIVTNFGLDNISFIVNATSVNTVDTRVNAIGLGFDFYLLDMVKGVINAYDNIACIARYNNTTSAWEFIDYDVDGSAHRQKGFASLTMPNGQTLRATYLRTDYTYVISLVSSPDETYTLNGVAIGPSVGLLYSDFQFSCSGLFGQITESGGVLSIDSLGFQNPLKDVTFDATSGVITITHSALSYSGVTISSMNIAHRPVLMPSGSSAIAFQMVDNSGAVVNSVTGMKFQVHRTGVRTLLNSEMGVSGSNIWIQGLMMKEYSLI